MYKKCNPYVVGCSAQEISVCDFMSLMPGTVVILWCDPAGFGFAGLLLYATEVALGYSVWSGINERLGTKMGRSLVGGMGSAVPRDSFEVGVSIGADDWSANGRRMEPNRIW